MVRTILGYGLSLVITLVLCESVLQLVDPPFLTIKTAEHHLWERDDTLGWRRIADNKGIFTNGYFKGEITTDIDSNRLNSPDGTYKKDYQNILFIGDSTTASLEVNDNQTIPALLEQSLRKNGKHYNVINLGVRGYGTDQSVMKAINNADKYRPTDIIYMFVSNDIYNNNTLKKHNRIYGKGAFVRKAGETSFTAHNIPVPEYEKNAASLIVFDDECRPFIHSVTLEGRPDTKSNIIKDWLKENIYVYRAIFIIKHAISASNKSHDTQGEQQEPYDLIKNENIKWRDSFATAYEDNGPSRIRCKEYLNSQIRFLLQSLKSNINSKPRVHLVQFPDITTLELLRNNTNSPNITTFKELLANSVINTYTNLPASIIEESVDINSMRCKGDSHFCERGNAWISSAIYEHIFSR